MERLDGIRKQNHINGEIYNQLRRFPVIEGMVVTGNKRQNIVSYYERLKSLDGCIKHPLFWLHYGMARLSFEQFREAEAYFDYARGLAKDGNGKYIRDIDNHYARLLLESRTNSDLYNDYIKAFMGAHRILINQMQKNNNRDYPYRQARNYVPFIISRSKNLSIDKIKKFGSSCVQIQKTISTLNNEIKRRSAVIECNNNMERAIEVAKNEILSRR